MSEKTLFCTGAGGFVGRHLLSRYLQREQCDIYLLEQGGFRERLERFLAEEITDEAQRRRIHVLSGDIARPGLGLERSITDELRDRVTHVIHLAALYNLSAPRDASVRVNVDGTRHVLDFLGGLRVLQRFAHTSTIAVSGRAGGVFREDDLDTGQRFKNFYDESKFLSERLVRERRGTIPTVILRPTTVVGHSGTGAIEKIDGPYYALGMILRNRHHVIPDTGDAKFHFAPVDFVADAYYHLFEDEASVGKVFHVVDPAPLTYVEFMELACDVLRRRRPTFMLPARVMRPMGHLPGFERITGVPREAFEASFYPVEYDTSYATPALAKHGVVCPHVRSYLGRMIEYFVEHADDPRIRKGTWREVTT